MPWYHWIATFLNDALPQFRATRRTNLALLTAAILQRRTLVISVLVRSWLIQLPYSHHQRKKRLFRFLSNTAFDSVAVQTALLGPICQAARLRGPVPIMIDWSDLGQGRNGLFAAVCFRGRGLPLLSWVCTPAELHPSQNRVEEFFIGRLLRHLPANIRPLLLADRGFGRASLIRFLQQMPRHTGYPVDYVVRLRGDVVVQSPDYRGRLRDYALRKGRINFWPQTLYRSDGAVVFNLILYWARGHREPWYLATSLTDPHRAVRMYRKRMQPEQYFKDGKQRFGLNRSTVTTTHRLQRLLVGLLLACSLLILAGMRASPTFRRQVCSRGKLGILHLGYEFYLGNPDPPNSLFPIHCHQTGYA
ncbi:MAG: transposase [Gemmatimonadota bacterium]|nr:transposase [Gemmatimonadota bacterium]